MTFTAVLAPVALNAAPLAVLLSLALTAGCRAPEPPPREPPRTEEPAPAPFVCGVCGKPIEGSYVTIGDAVYFHARCWDGSPRCDGCGLPAAGPRAPASRWKDGRITCSVCKRDAVLDAREAERVVAEARERLRAVLGLDVPDVPVPIKLVGRPELIAQAEEVGQPAIKALTVVREEAPPRRGVRGARSYRLLALYGLPRAALVGIVAHELFHVIQSEASPDDREPAFREGSANYVQVVLLRATGESLRAQLIERDTDSVYGEGLRRFERLAAARGQKAALVLGVTSLDFPQGF